MAAGGGATGRFVPAKQTRSRAAVERIIAAAEELMAQRPFVEVTVVELCALADVSTSSFYARFSSKDALLVSLFEQHVTEARARLEVSVSDARQTDPEVELIVRLVLGRFVEFVREHEPLIRSIYASPQLNERYWGLTREVTDVLCALLGDLYGRDDREFVQRLELGVRIAGAAVQRAIGLPMSFGERLGVGDDELVEELSVLLTAYFDRNVDRFRGSR